jgi:hypothetical protein
MRKTPFLHRPVHAEELSDKPEIEAGWLDPEAEATEWLSLFYGEYGPTSVPFSLRERRRMVLRCRDAAMLVEGPIGVARLTRPCADLVVVAVLTVFSSTHELSSPGSIAVFLS